MSLLAICDRAINQQKLIRRSLVVANFVLVWIVTWWAFEFAKISKFDGTGTAAVIVAVTGPLSLLTGQVFKLYNESRNGGEHG